MDKTEPNGCCRWIDFLSEGYRLKGMLHLPTAERPPVVIGSHGLLSSSESAKQRELAARCTAAGMGYFRFDHRGCGRSQGYFPEVTTLEGRVQDLI
ncbi:MAG: alpha/beta hydrolase [Desulfobacterales bacterium]